MNKLLFALSLGFGGLILATHQGFAAPQCGPRAEVIAQLADRFGETRRAIGLASNNAVVEVFAASRTGTWTIIATLPEGLSCLVASGESYEPLVEHLPATGDPA
jgi:hypothetical protein